VKITLAETCTGCGAPLAHAFADLGHMPPANSLVPFSSAHDAELHLPLRAAVCGSCFLVQLLDRVDPGEVFQNYPYFSSVSRAWLAHAEAFAILAASQLGVGPGKLVVELASNDGYLLQYMARTGARCLGGEPAANVAAAAEARGIPTLVGFFGSETARAIVASHGLADLVVANNVLAHVPMLHDFVAGIAILLQSNGVASIEFPHLLNLLRQVQFDTIYHEHYFYYSLLALMPILAKHGLVVADVEELPTHGGSLRVFVRHDSGAPQTQSAGVRALLDKERAAGLARIESYSQFQTKVERITRDLTGFLVAEAHAGHTVVGYGAAAKAATLLNMAGVRRHLLPYVCDASPHKVGNLIPGCRIPIVAPDAIDRDRPSTVLIFPWNLKDEIASDLARVRGWQGRFAIAVPSLDVF